MDKGDWSAGHRDLHLGTALIALAEEHSQFMEVVQVFMGGKSDPKAPAILRLTEKASQWLEERHHYFETLASPVHLPMIVRPRQWTGLRGGGYLANKDTELVKHRNNRRTIRALEKADLRQTLAAVNALQETPWRINSRIYRIIKRAWEEGHIVPGLPAAGRIPLPERLPEGTPEEILKQRKAERARIHQANLRAEGDRYLLGMRLRACEKLVNESEEELYFPYQLDHRGRIYPIPQVFNPQSDDMGRALLMFADGKPLGDRGARWLAIHLANTYGIDKVSFDQREDWVRANQERICESAAHPLDGTRFWVTADKPWCFLAACFEWVDHCSSGSNFRSHLPIAMDGTCNGLQHLSALGRDPVGGKATNLVPAAKPEDIYQQVANHVIHRLEVDASKGNERARTWLNKIDRKVVKRATMTTPYGVTPAGIRRQLIQDGFTAQFQDKWESADYLKNVLEDCIGEVVIKAKEIMDWLQQIARMLAKADRGIYWTVPTGFPVVHEYRKAKARRIVTAERTLTVYEEDSTLELKEHSQVNAIAPNFIHSLDAAHMMHTVNRLHEEGLRHFAMIHDSYGVHACDVDRMNSVLREEFVRIYSEQVMARFLCEQRTANADIALPEAPLQGDLVSTCVS